MRSAKAWTAVLASALAAAIINGIETAAGIDLPAEVEIGIVSAITGALTWLVPNAPA